MRLLNRSLNEATLSAEAARSAADATQKSVIVMTDTGRRQLRSYLHVYAKHLRHVRPSSTPEGEVELRNTGLTPARNVRIWLELLLVDEPFVQNWAFNPKNDESQAIVGPSASAFAYKSLDAVLSETDLLALTADRKRIYMIGMVKYDDVFNHECWTTFCARSFLVPEIGGEEVNLRWSSEGNDCDQD